MGLSFGPCLESSDVTDKQYNCRKGQGGSSLLLLLLLHCRHLLEGATISCAWSFEWKLESVSALQPTTVTL
jgi:hypothetical protein